MKSKIKAISYEDRARTFWFLASVCLISLGAYVYAVNATAHHVAMRAELEREAVELHTELAELEFQYIKLKNEVTIDVARELGFTEVQNPLYIARENTASLSFNSESR